MNKVRERRDILSGDSGHITIQFKWDFVSFVVLHFLHITLLWYYIRIPRVFTMKQCWLATRYVHNGHISKVNLPSKYNKLNIDSVDSKTWYRAVNILVCNWFVLHKWLKWIELFQASFLYFWGLCTSHSILFHWHLFLWSVGISRICLKKQLKPNPKNRVNVYISQQNNFFVQI